MLGAAALDRGRPAPWQVVTEVLRTAVVAAGFAWLVSAAGVTSLPGTLAPALVLWVTFPVVILVGSMTWERTPPVTAAIHAGDWLLKLVLIALAVGLLY